MLWSLILMIGLPSQQERSIDQVMRVDVVLLDLFVLDRNGLPIVDLTEDEFEVFENKRPVPTNFFDVLDFRESSPNSPETEDPMMQTMVLVLDLGRANLAITRQSLGELRAFLTALPSEFPMQLLIYSMDYGMVTQGFTTDQIAAMDDFTQFEINFLDRREKHPSYHEKFSLMTLEREILGCIPKTVTAPSAWRSSSATDMAKNCIRAAFDRFSHLQRQQSLKVLDSLEKVFASLARVAGLKTLYFITPGISTQPGKASALLATRYAQSLDSQQNSSFFGRTTNASTPGVPAGNLNSSPDFNTLINSRAPRSNAYDLFNLDLEFRRLAHMGLTTRTVIHAFTLPHNYLLDRRAAEFTQAGANYLHIQGAYTGYAQELDEGNEALARVTGGLHYRKEQLSLHLTTTLDRTRVYYVLGYAKPDQGRKAFRNIRIRCSREGTTVYHQRGYFKNQH